MLPAEVCDTPYYEYNHLRLALLVNLDAAGKESVCPCPWLVSQWMLKQTATLVQSEVASPNLLNYFVPSFLHLDTVLMFVVVRK